MEQYRTQKQKRYIFSASIFITSAAGPHSNLLSQSTNFPIILFFLFFASLWCVFWSFAHPKVMNCASHSDHFTSAFNGMFIDNDKNNTERVLCCFVSRVFDELREASNRTANLLRKILCLDRFAAAESDRVVESVKKSSFLCCSLGSFRLIQTRLFTPRAAT